MNVFVLSTGRCGSETFACACRFMTNYTVAHESHSADRLPKQQLAYSSLRYPANHIEVDNRLSWFLGTLDKEYGDTAFYVHLLRDPQQVSKSLVQRGTNSILFAFAWGTLQYFRHTHQLSDDEKHQIGLIYWRTVNENIELFLRNKTQKMTLWLPEIKQKFPLFWQAIGAQGDYKRSLAEWDRRHNATVAHRSSWRFDAEHYYGVHKSSKEIAAVVPPGSTCILVDDQAVEPELSLPERRLFSFFKPDGHYQGRPSDDATALTELRRLMSLGADYVVFMWPSFWWLDHYKIFTEYLWSHHQCLLQNERVVVFDLKAKPNKG